MVRKQTKRNPNRATGQASVVRSSGTTVTLERIERSILLLRGEKVMLDADFASLYRVQTKVLMQAVKRNLERFPADFMFQLSKDEFEHLRSQSVTSSSWGGPRYCRGCDDRVED